MGGYMGKQRSKKKGSTTVQQWCVWCGVLLGRFAVVVVAAPSPLGLEVRASGTVPRRPSVYQEVLE